MLSRSKHLFSFVHEHMRTFELTERATIMVDLVADVTEDQINEAVTNTTA